MRQLDTIRTCRRFISCAPLCKATSPSAITNSIPNQQTSGNNYARGIVKPVSQSIKLNLEKQYKMKFLMRCPKFMKKVTSFTESEIKMELRGSNLQLLGSQPDLSLFEEIFNTELNSIATQKVNIPHQPMLALGIYSTSETASQIKHGDKVQLLFNAHGPTAMNSWAVTGSQKDVNEFLKELAVKINSVSVNKFFIPSYLVPSRDFSKMLKFIRLPNTFCAVIKGNVELWSCDFSTKELAEAKIKEFIASQTLDSTGSINLSVPMKHYIFTMLNYQASEHVNITWKSYDGNTIAMEVQGPLSEVNKTKKEVLQICNGVQSVELYLPTSVQKYFDSSSFRSDLLIFAPTKEKPKLILHGKEHRINETLIKIYRRMQAFCSTKEFSKIETSIALSYANHVLFEHDEKNIKLLKRTFPEAAIDCVHLPDNSINVKVTANVDDLDAINNILKRQTVVQFFPSSRNEFASKVAQILQRNEKINNQVEIKLIEGHLLLSGPSPEHVEKAKELLMELHDFQYGWYTSTKSLLVPNNLLDEIRTVAAEYEILFDVKADPTSRDVLTIDFVGRPGNCLMFKTFLHSKLDHLHHLWLPSDRTREWILQRCLDQQIKDRTDLFVMYTPNLNSYWLGGERHAVQEVFDSIDTYKKNVSWQKLPVSDPRMENYLKNQIDILKFRYPEVDVAINNENGQLHVVVIGLAGEVQLVSDKLKIIMSETLVSEMMLNNNTFVESRSHIFLHMAMPNLKEKVLFKLWTRANNGVTLQMVGQTRDVNQFISNSPLRSDEENGSNDTVTIELPYTGKIYLNYLQTTLGICDLDMTESKFRMFELFHPKVRCSKNWNWDRLRINPDNRDKWTLTVGGKCNDVLETETLIKEAMKGMHFRQLKINCDHYSFIGSILMRSELVRRVIPDPDVHFYIEFYDYKNRTCYLNIFGDNKDKVEELVTKFHHYISEECTSVSFNVRDYTSLHEAKLKRLKTCFLYSDVAKELRAQHEQVAWYYHPEEHTIVLLGNKKLVSVYEEKVRKWLENIALNRKEYDDYLMQGARVRYPRYQQYCYKRWPPLSMTFQTHFGYIEYCGPEDHVANFKEYVDNEVVSDYEIGSPSDYGKIKRNLPKIACMYTGVFVKDDRQKLVLIGEKSDVACVRELLDIIVAGESPNKFTLELVTGDRVVNIPFMIAVQTLGSNKMRNLFPYLTWYVVGRKIVFKGPEDVVNEAVDLIGNLSVLQVPNSVMRGATLFRDHTDTTGMFKESHFIPPELTDRVFIQRNKWNRGRDREVYLTGKTDDLKALEQYFRHALPNIGVESRTIPLTPEQAMVLKTRRGWQVLFNDYLDKVAFSIGPRSVEVAGDPESVSLLVGQLENFVNEFKVIESPLQEPAQHKMWDRRCVAKFRQQYPKAWFINGLLFRRKENLIVGDREEVTHIENSLRKEQKTQNTMNEMMICHMHDIDW